MALFQTGAENRQKHLLDANLLHKESPFGNYYTPVIKSKIIGGKIVNVREENPMLKHSPRGFDGPHPLSPAPRNPSEHRQLSQPNTPSTTRRETPSIGLPGDHQARISWRQSLRLNEDIELSLLKIGAQGYSRQELESREKEIRHQPESPRKQQQSDRLTLNPYSPLPPISSRHTTPGHPTAPPLPPPEAMSAALTNLYNLLPGYHGRLTSSPLQLTREDEYVVMREVLKQLRFLDPTKLKQVYMELANYDDDLSGLCLFDDLLKAFAKNNISMPNPLARLVASMFISAAEPHRINYEKVLSFIGACLKTAGTDNNFQLVNSSQYDSSAHHRTSYQQSYDEPQRLSTSITERMQQQQQQQAGSHSPVYYQQDLDYPIEPSAGQAPASHRTPGGGGVVIPPGGPVGGVLTDRDLPRVLRQLEAELATIDRPVNFETLRLAFQRADRLLRGTLSREQLKQLVWDFRIPMREHVLDNVISLCRHRGGGQYDWEQFLQFMERMTPQNTGLRIPSSKKPIEFAKHFPQPAPSWPHAEATAALPAAGGRQAAAGGPHSMPALPPPPLPLGRPQEPLYRSRSPPPPQPQQTQLQYLQQQQQILTQRDLPPAPSPARPLPNPQAVSEPWFNRFMKLADALYRNDNDSRGFLNEDQVRRLVDRYNQDYQLELDQTSVQAALNATRGSSGRVDINAFLKRLAVRVN